jgi:hypothetical protein
VNRQREFFETLTLKQCFGLQQSDIIHPVQRAMVKRLVESSVRRDSLLALCVLCEPSVR